MKLKDAAIESTLLVAGAAALAAWLFAFILGCAFVAEEFGILWGVVTGGAWVWLALTAIYLLGDQ